MTTFQEKSDSDKVALFGSNAALADEIVNYPEMAGEAVYIAMIALLKKIEENTRK